MRVANITGTLEGHGLHVIDKGNLSGPSNPWLPPVNGYRHLAEVAHWNRSLHDAVYAELQQGRLPIVLGGDHCLGIGLHQCSRKALPRYRQKATRALA